MKILDWLFVFIGFEVIENLFVIIGRILVVYGMNGKIVFLIFICSFLEWNINLRYICGSMGDGWEDVGNVSVRMN